MVSPRSFDTEVCDTLAETEVDKVKFLNGDCWYLHIHKCVDQSHLVNGGTFKPICCLAYIAVNSEELEISC